MKISVVFGTRPEAIKLVPLIFKLRDKFDVKIISSGQHDTMLDQVLDLFQIKADYSLHCMHEVPKLEKLAANITYAVGDVLNKENPDLVIVQGDTMTVFQTAFTAFLCKKPVFHLEAGLRTSHKYSPFPEEMFRTLVGKLADFHFAPTIFAKENLINEGVKQDRILVIGNTVVDALLLAEKLINKDRVLSELNALNFPVHKMAVKSKNVLITLHRRENIGRHFQNATAAIADLAERYPEINFIWFQHKNPEVRSDILSGLGDIPDNIILSEPVSYETLVYFMKNCFLVMTDSGGIQEESPTFGKPVIVLRESTERPELVSNGNGFVVGEGIARDKIIEIFIKFYTDQTFYRNVSQKPNPFGDGKASERIVELISSEQMADFIKRYPDSAELKIEPAGIDEFRNAPVADELIFDIH